MQPPKPNHPPKPVSLPRPSLPKSLPPPPPVPAPAPSSRFASPLAPPVHVEPSAPVPARVPPPSVPPPALPPPSLPSPALPPAFTESVQETELVFEASPALPPAFAEPVQETDLVFETAEPRLAQPSLVRRTLRRIAERKDKGTLAVWCFFGCVGLLVVLQRNGIFYTVANFIGQGREYVALETELLGGPGEGTQRGAEALLRASLPSGQVPFSEVSARVKQENP